MKDVVPGPGGTEDALEPGFDDAKDPVTGENPRP